jgi:hypothetical protein
MKHQILLFLSVGVIFFFILLNIELPHGNNITGAAIIDETEDTYAIALAHLVNRFFNIQGIRFPIGSCGDVIRELYSNVAYEGLTATSGFSTDGQHRLATVSFAIEPIDTFGTIDMVKSSILNGENVDSFITMSAETIVRVPKDTRSTYLFMDLYGISDGAFNIIRGEFSTPSVDCSFITRDGVAICDCNVHRIYGIEIGGETISPFVQQKII